MALRPPEAVKYPALVGRTPPCAGRPPGRPSAGPLGPATSEESNGLLFSSGGPVFQRTANNNFHYLTVLMNGVTQSCQLRITVLDPLTPSELSRR
jgi:hypothetical protein